MVITLVIRNSMKEGWDVLVGLGSGGKLGLLPHQLKEPWEPRRGTEYRSRY